MTVAVTYISDVRYPYLFRTCHFHTLYKVLMFPESMVGVRRQVIWAPRLYKQTVGTEYIKQFVPAYLFLLEWLMKHMIEFASSYTWQFHSYIPYHTHNIRGPLPASDYFPLLTVIFLPAYPEQSADSADTFGFFFFIFIDCSEEGNYFSIPSPYVSGTDFSFYFDGQNLDWYSTSTGMNRGYGDIKLEVMDYAVVSTSPLTLVIDFYIYDSSPWGSYVETFIFPGDFKFE